MEANEWVARSNIESLKQRLEDGKHENETKLLRQLTGQEACLSGLVDLVKRRSAGRAQLNPSPPLEPGLEPFVPSHTLAR